MTEAKQPAVICPRIELTPGYSISRLITGCWQLASDHGAGADAFGDLTARWRAGLEAGYTTFDCADIYAGVEQRLGRFLGGLDFPDRVEVHTKYVPDRDALARVDGFQVRQAVERSCARLGREALDLVQFHWWDYTVPGYVEAALALDALRRAGTIRHLGLTNFDLLRMQEIVEAGVEVASVQVQYSLLDRRPENGLAQWCSQRGIGLLAYGTLAGGLLSEHYHGRCEPERSGWNRSQIKYGLIVDELGGWSALQEILDALAAVAARHQTTLPIAAVRWALERPATQAAVVGASRRDRRASLEQLWAPGWDDERWPELSSLLARNSGPRGPVYGLERDPGSPHLSILRMNQEPPGD